MLKFLRPRENSVFAVHAINGVKLLICLRLDFSQLSEDKLRHNSFNDKEPKTILHYLLCCDFYSIY